MTTSETRPREVLFGRSAHRLVNGILENRHKDGEWRPTWGPAFSAFIADLYAHPNETRED